MKARSLILLLPLYAACSATGIGDNPSYYDAAGVAPTISSVSPDSETGNVGGGTVTIEGSGFTSDPDQVMVVFGGQNATIQSVSDTELVVKVPHGPIEGGAVYVTVGTSGGQATLDDAYDYTMDDIDDGQTAYVTASEISYAGDYTFDGLGEFYEIVYPRIHTPSVGYWGTVDVDGEWKLEVPDQAEFAEWVDELRLDIGDEITLETPDLRGNADQYACYRPDYSFSYGGGVEDGDYYSPVTVTASLSDQDGCDGDGEITYDRAKIRFCKAPSSTVKDLSYVADWPLREEPLSADNLNSLEAIVGVDDDGTIKPDASTTVQLHLNPGDDGDGITLVLPERFKARGVAGFGVGSTPTQQEQWGGAGVDSCFDSNDDGETTLDDTALSWEWDPASMDDDALLAAAQQANPSGLVEDVRTYVNASVIYGAFSWIGLEGFAARSSIQVPDSVGGVDMPASVLYQLPTLNSSWGGLNAGNPAENDYGVLFMAVTRVVEYRLNTDQGKVVFSFVDAELGATGWQNPRDADGCSDCLDNDGDGWTDAADPDCKSRNATEEVGYSDYTCNDGLDNDDDGDIDGDDSVCEQATDGEDNCADGRDNDHDGNTDEEDCECISGMSESGGDESALECCNGLDDDGDGWLDSSDPSCGESGAEDGIEGTACNDGVDNDGNGDIDAADPFCLEEGATSDSETPSFRVDCADSTDNDGDGYTDGNDPGCEFPYYNHEDSVPDDTSWIPTCNDGADNDGDGYVDVDDPDCALSDGTPNGFQPEDTLDSAP